MKVIEIKGDMFDHVNEGDAIAHGVNCRGFMGSGIALPIKNMFPNNFLAYNDQCNGQKLQPGEVLVGVENGITIFNMATQFEPGPDARYLWVNDAAVGMYTYCIDNGISTVKMPKIGCGIGGLEWGKVRNILEEIETDEGQVTLEVYFLEN